MTPPAGEPTVWQLVILAIVQGITEFLPISSSAHLILVPQLLGWPDQGLALDGALHLGTLTAVLWYFRKGLWPLTRDWGTSLRTRTLTPHGRLAWAVLLGTAPAALAGLLAHDWIAQSARDIRLIAATTLGYGLLMGVADRYAARRDGRDEFHFRARDAVFIACAQALALVPGTSRSGITMTVGLLCGLSRTGAARFSFLLSIPVTALAGGYEGLALLREADGTVLAHAAIAAGTAAVAGYLAIAFLIRLLQQRGLMPFVIYRLALGALLVGVAVSGTV
jgi:undecaprenyl-diphosphatase